MIPGNLESSALKTKRFFDEESFFSSHTIAAIELIDSLQAHVYCDGYHGNHVGYIEDGPHTEELKNLFRLCSNKIAENEYICVSHTSRVLSTYYAQPYETKYKKNVKEDGKLVTHYAGIPMIYGVYVVRGETVLSWADTKNYFLDRGIRHSPEIKIIKENYQKNIGLQRTAKSAFQTKRFGEASFGKSPYGIMYRNVNSFLVNEFESNVANCVIQKDNLSAFGDKNEVF